MRRIRISEQNDLTPCPRSTNDKIIHFCAPTQQRRASEMKNWTGAPPTRHTEPRFLAEKAEIGLQNIFLQKRLGEWSVCGWCVCFQNRANSRDDAKQLKLESTKSLFVLKTTKSKRFHSGVGGVDPILNFRFGPNTHFPPTVVVSAKHILHRIKMIALKSSAEGRVFWTKNVLHAAHARCYQYHPLCHTHFKYFLRLI